MPNVSYITRPRAVAAAGLPIIFELESEPLGDEEFAFFYCSDLAAVAAGDYVEVAGYRFTCTDAEVGYGQFPPGTGAGGDTALAIAGLLYALSETPLSAAFRIETDDINVVQGFARAGGPAWNVAVAGTGGLAGSYAIDAAASLRSETRLAWGCYLELYAYPLAADRNRAAPPADEATAQLLTRLELPFAAGNLYRFDVAPWLRALLAADCPTPVGGAGLTDRQVGYYVRFGEVYRTTGNAYRRRYEAERFPPDYATANWAVDAADADYSFTPGTFLTTFRGERPFRYVPGAGGEDEPALLICATIWQTVATQNIAFVVESPDGEDDEVDAETYVADAAGVVFYAWPLSAPLAIARYAALRFEARNDRDVALDTLRFVPRLTGQTLVWANRQGGWDSWCFSGAAEIGGKRTAATYADGAGNTQALRVDLTLPTRLHSELLTRAAYGWLSVELAASPVVYWQPSAEAGEWFPVLVTDFDRKADVVLAEYTLAVEVTPTAPFTPLLR